MSVIRAWSEESKARHIAAILQAHGHCVVERVPAWRDIWVTHTGPATIATWELGARVTGTKDDEESICARAYQARPPAVSLIEFVTS